VYVNSRNPVRLLAGAERVPDSTLLRVSGYRRVHCDHDHAHLFAQPHTRRISQFCGLDLSTGSSISPLRAGAILPNAGLIFMRFRELRPRALVHHAPREGVVRATSPVPAASAPLASSAR
jgi:hypothetical protein